MAFCHAPPTSLGFEGLLRAKISGKVSLPRVVRVSLRQKTVKNHIVFSFAASREESLRCRDVNSGGGVIISCDLVVHIHLGHNPYPKAKKTTTE